LVISFDPPMLMWRGSIY